MNRIAKIMSFVFVLGYAQMGASEETKLDENKFRQAQDEIKLVISDQIKAFTRVDVDRAYYHASKTIKSIFPTSEIFGSMVKKSYPMIWAPKKYQFLSSSYLAEGMVQKVMFIDSVGGMHFFDYALENNGERWVISGVYMVKGEEGA